MDNLTLQRISQTGVIAVVTIEQADDAVPLAQALLDGGVDSIELTLRSEEALDAIAAIHKSVPQMLLGAGTVLTVDQVQSVRESGAEFAVAPGLNTKVIRAAQAIKLPFAPGVATPSDIEAALECGCTTLKFFPAEPIGGLRYLRSMATPYRHLGVQFIPLGGLNGENMCDYLADPLVCAIGGSWIAPLDLIRQKQWNTIRSNAKAARDAVDQIRDDLNTSGSSEERS